MSDQVTKEEMKQAETTPQMLERISNSTGVPTVMIVLDQKNGNIAYRFSGLGVGAALDLTAGVFNDLQRRIAEQKIAMKEAVQETPKQ